VPRRGYAVDVGAGPLDVLLADEAVTDILVNGPGPVWVDRGEGVALAGLSIDDEATLRALAQRLATACGRRLDESAPFVDARLPDGTRVHAVLPPLAPQGTTMSLRVPPRRTFRLDDLVDRRALTADAAALLRAVVHRRVAFVVTGGTGSGKTTLLSTLLSEAQPGERLLIVEDAPELRPAHDHIVRLQVRHANAEGAGGITMAELVRQALRMRPDRLVVGEVRGAEVIDLLLALNTGHEGGAATVHANRGEQLPARLEALCALGGIGRAAAVAQMVSAVQAVIHLQRRADGVRTVSGIGVLQPVATDCAVVLPAYVFGADGVMTMAGAATLDALIG
jgi:pilus assembly protein CpaF